jgi:hypothetical protein
MAFGIGEKFENNVEILYPDTDSFEIYYENRDNEVKPTYIVLDQKNPPTLKYVLKSKIDDSNLFIDANGKHSIKFHINLVNLSIQSLKMDIQARMLDEKYEPIGECDFSIINTKEILKRTRYLLTFGSVDDETDPIFYLNQNFTIKSIFIQYPTSIKSCDFELDIKIFKPFQNNYFEKISSRTINVQDSNHVTIPLDYHKLFQVDSSQLSCKWHIEVFLNNMSIGHKTSFKIISSHEKKSHTNLVKELKNSSETLEENKVSYQACQVYKKTENILNFHTLDILGKIYFSTSDLRSNFELKAMEHLKNAYCQINDINGLEQPKKDLLRKALNDHVFSCLDKLKS